MDRIEKLQRDFTALSPEVRQLPYNERLKEFKVSSLQRRFERYRVMYLWKCLNGIVPNCGVTIASSKESRQGLMVKIPGRLRSSAQKLREYSFLYQSSKLFNSLPLEIRNSDCDSTLEFKAILDFHLAGVDDIPRIAESTEHTKNSIIDRN